MKSLSNDKSTSGFTLIELLIVLTVIGILAAIVIPNLLTALSKSRQTATATLLRSYGTALDLYKLDHNIYPQVSTIAEVQPLLLPYSATLRLQDDWRNDLAYTSGDAESYSVESYGSDGIDGANVTPETRYIFTLDIVYSNGHFTSKLE